MCVRYVAGTESDLQLASARGGRGGRQARGARLPAQRRARRAQQARRRHVQPERAYGNCSHAYIPLLHRLVKQLGIIRSAPVELLTKLGF